MANLCQRAYCTFVPSDRRLYSELAGNDGKRLWGFLGLKGGRDGRMGESDMVQGLVVAAANWALACFTNYGYSLPQLPQLPQHHSQAFAILCKDIDAVRRERKTPECRDCGGGESPIVVVVREATEGEMVFPIPSFLQTTTRIRRDYGVLSCVE